MRGGGGVRGRSAREISFRTIPGITQGDDVPLERIGDTDATAIAPASTSIAKLAEIADVESRGVHRLPTDEGGEQAGISVHVRIGVGNECRSVGTIPCGADVGGNYWIVNSTDAKPNAGIAADVCRQWGRAMLSGPPHPLGLSPLHPKL